jgi:hypothetical protein
MADSTANYNMWCLFQKIRKNQSIQGKEIYSRKNYQDRRFFSPAWPGPRLYDAATTSAAIDGGKG